MKDDSKFKDGTDILNYAFTQILNNGTIKSENDRGQKVFIYNCKAANFIFDMINLVNHTSPTTLKLSNDENKKVTNVVNLILTTYFNKLSGNTKAKDLYEEITDAEQEGARDLSFLNYDFVQELLNSTNKEKVTTNKDDLIQKNLWRVDPLAIGS